VSGVYGVAGPGPSADLSELMDRMARSHQHRPWMTSRSVVDLERGVGIGHLGIGLLNAGPQPLWNATRTVALVMAGELDAFPADPEAAALEMYEVHGEGFAHRLAGAFVIAIWDSSRERIVLTNDRFGLYNLFYAHRGGRLLFSPEVKGILVDSSIPRRIDLTALAQYMRFQHLLGTRTFLEDIALLPPASVLTFQPGDDRPALKTYWSFADLAHQPNVERGEAAEEAGRLLRRAVERMSGDRLRPGVYLSGGLDSRTILGLIRRRPVASVTYGVANCRDVYLAARIAQAEGSDHHWVDLPDGGWVLEQAALHLALTEGHHSWIHAHGMSTFPAAREWMDVSLTGWDGGTVMGHPESVETLLVNAVDDEALVNRLFFLFNQKFTWPSLMESEERLLFAEPYRSQLRGRAFESFRQEIGPYLHLRPDVRAELFFLRNHCGRLTQNMVTFARSHLEVRFPFFDYRLVEFLYSIPSSVRGARSLYQAVMERELPHLTRIPYDYDELLPTSRRLRRGIHMAGVQIRRSINRHIRPLFRERATLYADYENYLRRELRPWAEGILNDRRTAERGLFDPPFLRSLMKRHVSGLEHWTIGKIAPIITYELMLRQLVD